MARLPARLGSAYLVSGDALPILTARLALGVGHDDGVDISDDGELVATFGRFRIKTTLDNIDHTRVAAAIGK